jgi:hypothetical protein
VGRRVSLKSSGIVVICCVVAGLIRRPGSRGASTSSKLSFVSAVSEWGSTSRWTALLGYVLLRWNAGAGVRVVAVVQRPSGVPRARELPIEAHSRIEHEGCKRTDQQGSE